MHSDGVSGRNRILILLATFNGSQFLDDQLSSFLAQTDPSWDLLVSDDNSTDNTVDILERFKGRTMGEHSVQIVQGPGKGHAQNFLSLIQRTPQDASFVAFSDQDDVWLPTKLSRARAMIEATRPADLPILYAASSYICDEGLILKGQAPSFRRRQALVTLWFNLSGGGTQ